MQTELKADAQPPETPQPKPLAPATPAARHPKATDAEVRSHWLQVTDRELVKLLDDEKSIFTNTELLKAVELVLKTGAAGGAENTGTEGPAAADVHAALTAFEAAVKRVYSQPMAELPGQPPEVKGP